MTAMKKKCVCLFGSSLNPPTGIKGHLGITQYLSSLVNNTTKESTSSWSFDEIRVLPVYNHMFQSKRENMESFDHRCIMSQLTFRGVPHVTVSMAEKECYDRTGGGKMVGTADLLEMLLLEEPDTDFALVLGSDTFMDLTDFKWRRSKDIFALTVGRILVIRRKLPDALSDDSNKHFQLLKDRVDSVNNSSELNGSVRILDIPSLSDVSSTAVRSCADQNKLLEWVKPEVLDYMRKHKLYAFASPDDS